jgi:hypothetical protein
MIGRKWRLRVQLGLVGLAATAVGLAGCGDGSPDSGQGGVATIAVSPAADETSSNATETTSNSDPEAPSGPDEAFELFNECMSELGFDIEASGPGSDSGEVVVQGGSSSDEAGDGPVIMGPGGVRIDPEDAEQFEEANQACAVHLANVQGELADVSPEQQAAMEDATLRVQECMQEKGFDVQLSVSIGGGPGIGTNAVNSEDDGPPKGEPLNPDDIDREALDAATRECNAIFDEYEELDDLPLPGR